MTIGAIAATYLSIWAIALLLAVSWSKWRRERARHGVDEGMARVPLMPMVIQTSFVAALFTGVVVFLMTIGG